MPICAWVTIDKDNAQIDTAVRFIIGFRLNWIGSNNTEHPSEWAIVFGMKNPCKGRHKRRRPLHWAECPSARAFCRGLLALAEALTVLQHMRSARSQAPQCTDARRTPKHGTVAMQWGYSAESAMGCDTICLLPDFLSREVKTPPLLQNSE